MEDYLEKLKNLIEKKNIKSFWVFTDSDEFKTIKKTKKDIIEKLKNHPNKYGSQNIANVTLTVRSNGLKKNDWIFAVKIDIYEIDENGLINQSPNDTWSLLLKYKETKHLFFSDNHKAKQIKVKFLNYRRSNRNENV